MLHTNGYKLKSLRLESAAASSFASLLAYFENANVYTNPMMAPVNATEQIVLGDSGHERQHHCNYGSFVDI
jgi:hypothetical protein